MMDTNTVLSPIIKLSRDLRSAAVTLTAEEARFLVDAYYTSQENRIRADGQRRSMGGEPHEVLDWLSEQTGSVEDQIKGALKRYAEGQPIGQWALGICGIGPVITAGLLANIDIRVAETAGQVWRYAGLDPTSSWLGREKAATAITRCTADTIEGVVAAVCAAQRRNAERYYASLEGAKPTKANFTAWLAKRPWNASLKRLTWIIGESFVKVSSNEKDYYGKIYVQRKAEEMVKNANGDFDEQAAAALRNKNYGKETDAYAFYSNGMLPPAHIHARAKRYAVKLFLSHFWEKWRTLEGLPVAAPYPIAHLGHAHKIEVP